MARIHHTLPHEFNALVLVGILRLGILCGELVLLSIEGGMLTTQICMREYEYEYKASDTDSVIGHKHSRMWFAGVGH